MPDTLNLPVSRNKMFYSEDDFVLENDIVLEYLEGDLNQTVVVYPVDREKTQINAISQSAVNGIRFKNPIEIPCMFEIEDSELKTFDRKTSNGVYALTGNLTVIVSVKTLEKYECEINRGDYIGVYVEEGRMVYFAVTDDGKVNTSNKNYIGAYKPGWRKITASPQTEFNGN